MLLLLLLVIVDVVALLLEGADVVAGGSVDPEDVSMVSEMSSVSSPDSSGSLLGGLDGRTLVILKDVFFLLLRLFITSLTSASDDCCCCC